MHVIGLTGGIACGKSLASSYLKEKGFSVIDCDEINKKLQLLNPEVQSVLKANFPLAFDDEKINRKKLAEIVYQSEIKLHLINQLMLPFIIKEIQSELNFLKQLNTKVVFIDAPLLFENGLDRLCDKTVCIYVDEKIIKQRFLERPEKTLEIFEKVISAQMPLDIKKKKADESILSDNKKDFFKRIDLFLENIINI